MKHPKRRNAILILILPYRLPFSTGSKTSRGGRGCHLCKNDLISIFERDDLNIMDANYEAVWIEIEIEKAKDNISGYVLGILAPTYEIGGLS